MLDVHLLKNPEPLSKIPLCGEPVNPWTLVAYGAAEPWTPEPLNLWTPEPAFQRFPFPYTYVDKGNKRNEIDAISRHLQIKIKKTVERHGDQAA